jgi:pimeloyl-ACP methyl ester carboxylesterase
MAMIRRRGAVWTVVLLAAALAVGIAAAGPLVRAVAAVRLVSAMVQARPPETAPGMPANYRVEGRSYRADLYRAAPSRTAPSRTDRGRAPLVLVPGAARRGKDDPRLVRFAAALANAGFLVLVPEIESLKSLSVGPGDVGAIADAVHHLSALGGGAPVGLAAISYAAGPAILAALDARIAAKVAFVAAVGGYYDMTALVTFFTTGHFRGGPGEPWRKRVPHPYGMLVFAVSNIPRLGDARDRALFEKMVRAKLAHPASDIAPLVADLGPEGRAFWALLDNRDPDRVAPLLAALPEAIRAAISGVDLAARDLSRLRARLILIHGHDDPVIPYTESLALAQAAPPGQARLYLVPQIAHVTLRGAGVKSAWAIFRAAYALMGERAALERWAAK